MSYAFVHDVPATWDTYRSIAETLSPDRPEGLLVHAAGPTDEGFRIIGIWDSREMCDRFHDERLRKILKSLTRETRIQATYRELQVAHLITGRSPEPGLEERFGAHDGHFVSEYEMSATADGKRIGCDGVDVIAVTNGRTARKDTYLGWPSIQEQLGSESNSTER